MFMQTGLDKGRHILSSWWYFTIYIMRGVHMEAPVKSGHEVTVALSGEATALIIFS